MRLWWHERLLRHNVASHVAFSSSYTVLVIHQCACGSTWAHGVVKS